MVATVNLDEFKSTVTLTADGYELTRVVLVEDFVLTSADSVLFDVLEDNIGLGMPAYGDPHPVKTALLALDFSVEPHGAENYLVTIIYRMPQPAEQVPDDTGPGVVEVGASVVDVEESHDRTGAVVTVAHDYALTKPERGLETHTAVFDSMKPQALLRQSRREGGHPFAKAATFVGTVNDAIIWSQAKNTLLCTRIGGYSNDGGISWTVDYEFQYDPGGWQARVVFNDAETGVPPSALLAVGDKLIDHLPEANFSLLNLTF